MAMTHMDDDHQQEQLREIVATLKGDRDRAWRQLEAEAEAAVTERTSTITSEGDPVREWEAYGVTVRELPERETDEALNLCRVSLGFSPTEGFSYCVFRGPVSHVKDVLRRALNALRDAP